MIMPTFIFSIALFCSLSAFSAEPFSSEQEARIKAMIRETLVNNPAILAEAADSYNKLAARTQNDLVAQVVKRNHNALFEDPGSPQLGAAHPVLKLVYFTDYNCVFCKKFEVELERLMKAYPDIAVVLKPLPYRSETSLTSARLALTVWGQQPERFMALHQRLMAKKGYHDETSIAAAMKQVGLKVKVPSQASIDTVNLNLTLAQQLGVQGTPATLVGNSLISGAVSYEQLESVVKAVREEG